MSPGVGLREPLFLPLLPRTMKGHVLPGPAENVISICCSFLSWLPAPLPESWLLQSAAYLRVSLRLPGAPLWGGGSRAGVHPGRGRPEARSARDQPFPEGPTAEKARRQGYRCRQGPDPTTCNQQTACSTRVSTAAAPLLILAQKEPRPRQIWKAKTMTTSVVLTCSHPVSCLLVTVTV